MHVIFTFQLLNNVHLLIIKYKISEKIEVFLEIIEKTIVQHMYKNALKYPIFKVKVSSFKQGSSSTARCFNLRKLL